MILTCDIVWCIQLKKKCRTHQLLDFCFQYKLGTQYHRMAFTLTGLASCATHYVGGSERAAETMVKALSYADKAINIFTEVNIKCYIT